MKQSRPQFIAGSIAAAAALGLGAGAAAAAGDIPKRKLGRTGAMVSIVAMGGYHIGKPDQTDAESIALIHEAVDRGINFLDNSWDYNMGESEVRMGKALAVGGYRDRVFLMTKVDGRTKAAAQGQLEQSLQRLQTDHVDLWQFHENIRPDDADRIFAPGGAFEAALAAKQAGTIKHIGFTGHKSPEYHLHMIDVAKKHGFVFDTVQMPLNVMDAHFHSFEQRVLPVATSLGMGVIGMKTFGDPHIYETHAVPPIDMLHYGMNLPVSTIVTGIDKPEILTQALAAASSFKPLSREAVAAILAKTKTLAMDGKTELYKTSTSFDSTTQHPNWLEDAKMS